jgi:hypothetical protein
MNLDGPSCDKTEIFSTLSLLLLFELVGIEGLELAKLIKIFVVEITRFIDGSRGMGVSGLLPFPPKKNYLIEGVSFICSVALTSCCNLAPLRIVGFDSPANSSGFPAECSSSVVEFIFIISYVSSNIPSSCLSLPEPSYLSPNLSFNHRLASITHLFNSRNSSNSLI